MFLVCFGDVSLCKSDFLQSLLYSTRNSFTITIKYIVMLRTLCVLWRVALLKYGSRFVSVHSCLEYLMHIFIYETWRSFVCVHVLLSQCVIVQVSCSKQVKSKQKSKSQQRTALTVNFCYQRESSEFAYFWFLLFPAGLKWAQSVKGAYSSSWDESHHRETGRHLPHGITQCYLPPDTREHAPP